MNLAILTSEVPQVPSLLKMVNKGFEDLTLVKVEQMVLSTENECWSARGQSVLILHFSDGMHMYCGIPERTNWQWKKKKRTWMWTWKGTP